MEIDDFDFELDKSFIANHPAVPRDSSKLLIYDTKQDLVIHETFSNLGNYLKSSDMLVWNRSKVVPARINFDGNKEVFVLRNLGENLLEVMVRPGRFFKVGKKVFLDEVVSLEVIRINEDGTRVVRFHGVEDFDQYLKKVGKMPLPPYIENLDVQDEQYQTVYAKDEGSRAAPTAGLHFTPDLISGLKEKGVRLEEVLLHVGRGTFLPVTVNKVEDHVMHEEYFELPLETASEMNKLIDSQGRLIAVGTTTVRVLEHCYSFEKGYEATCGETKIFIYPEKHKWSPLFGLITNFHLPKSTLLLLVASFLEKKGVENPSKKLLELYEIAKKENYRFFSFGDAMFIF